MLILTLFSSHPMLDVLIRDGVCAVNMSNACSVFQWNLHSLLYRERLIQIDSRMPFVLPCLNIEFFSYLILIMNATHY